MEIRFKSQYGHERKKISYKRKVSWEFGELSFSIIFDGRRGKKERKNQEDSFLSFSVVYFIRCPHSLTKEVIWPIYIVEKASWLYFVRQYLCCCPTAFFFSVRAFVGFCFHMSCRSILLGIILLQLPKRPFFPLHTTWSIKCFSMLQI